VTSTSSGTERIVRRASLAAYVVAGAGLVALVTIGLFFWLGQPWGTINDLALPVMTAALAPLMVAFWELGGLTPTPLALVAQISGWVAVIVWCAIQALMIIGVVAFDYSGPAGGAFAIQSVALAVIGLWIAGANLLAGPWLNWLRWPGLLSGIGIVLFAAGLLMGGVDHSATVIGGLAYLIVLPSWAFLMGRLLAGRTNAT
jgi:hypothetical protein